MRNKWQPQALRAGRVAEAPLYPWPGRTLSTGPERANSVTAAPVFESFAARRYAWREE
jgi:hypothetical protein